MMVSVNLCDVKRQIEQGCAGMSLGFKNRLGAGVTVVANEFIDRYMAEAGGEYVKVYLYLLRHGNETVTVEAAAEALHHTEADVRRAFAYWQRVGVLEEEEIPKVSENCRENGLDGAFGSGRSAGFGRGAVAGKAAGRTAGTSRNMGAAVQAAGETAASRSAGLSYDSLPCSCDLTKLDNDENFKQLVFITEQYLNKAGKMTATDCQILANLYSNLKLSPELLEYLMEYCAQNHHYSLRYAEKVALNWHEKNITTVEEAKAYSRGFSKESFAVMKAMGLTGRNPADSEFALMEKWFRQYGFTREIVVEACSRTIRSIQTPSFQYADKILTDWKEAGVRTFSDIAALDKKRKEKNAFAGQERGAAGNGNSERGRAGQEAYGRRDSGRGASGTGVRRGGKTANRFHNLEEHGYDYDEMVWNMINPGQETGGSDGAQ